MNKLQKGDKIQVIAHNKEENYFYFIVNRNNERIECEKFSEMGHAIMAQVSFGLDVDTDNSWIDFLPKRKKRT